MGGGKWAFFVITLIIFYLFMIKMVGYSKIGIILVIIIGIILALIIVGNNDSKDEESDNEDDSNYIGGETIGDDELEDDFLEEEVLEYPIDKRERDIKDEVDKQVIEKMSNIKTPRQERTNVITGVDGRSKSDKKYGERDRIKERNRAIDKFNNSGWG